MKKKNLQETFPITKLFNENKNYLNKKRKLFLYFVIVIN